MSHTITPEPEDQGADVIRFPGAPVDFTKEQLPPGLIPAPAGEVTLVQIDEDDDQEREELPAVIPATFRDPAVWEQRRRSLMHAAAFHAVRSPFYAGRAVRVAGIGVKASLRDAWSFLTAAEYGELSDKVRRTGAGPEHIADLRADRMRVAAERRREPMVVWSLTGISTYVASIAAVGQAWSLGLVPPALLPALIVLYALGRREIKRRTPEGTEFSIVDVPAGGEDQVLLLGADTIADAFRTAGLTKGDEEVSLVGPVRATANDAAEVTVRLPRNLKPSTVFEKRDALAAALQVDPTWLDVSLGDRPQTVSLWVASSDPLAKAAPSPLLDDPKNAQVDVWKKGVPFGRNRRGETVYMPFRHVNGLIGGTTRSGKGMSLRNIIPALGLDPRVRIRLVVGAKPGEHRAYAPITHTFFGKRPARLLELLDAMIEEADRRETVLEDEGRAKFNEKDLDRFPLEVLIVDEFPQYTLSKERIPDPSDEDGKRTLKVGEEIEHRLSKLAAYCTALNMDIVLLAQDPDANTVPRGFRNNTGSRTAFRTNSAVQTNAILKDGSTGAGLRAHDIKVSQPGVAIVDLDGAEGQLIRTFFVPDDRSEGEADPIAPVIAEGVARRKAAGRLAGQDKDPIEEHLLYFTGESSEAGGPTGSGRPGEIEGTTAGPTGLLADLLDVFAKAGDPDRLRTSEILAGLAAIDPATWSPDALGVEADDERGYGRVGGRRLADAIAQALDGTGRTLVAREWTAGGRGRGYLLAEVREAAGITP
ncbi:FtsK/SpoIIIE domain-containing protein [Streptomyces abyssomicinicus]|uniref:FtsK/SpoIIIE domain-containing protein n=1 Tax=Streptomyces abyssomicinicus TaxID=574929 RepID=UPI00124FE3E8|nr:FtsK/SpoIIIE domain-containing protein [Streptomyces abyssomicinicus]